MIFKAYKSWGKSAQPVVPLRHVKNGEKEYQAVKP
jgi:hypothetical protein